jgi:transcriptional regulator with XRE-family HTH domain
MAGYQTVAQRNLTCAIRIRERRRQLGLTQAELVDLVDEHGSRLSSQALSAIENGRRLAVGRLPDLAAALQCTVSYLLGLTAEPHRWEPDDASAPAPARRAAPPVPARRTAAPASAPAGQAPANGAANQSASPRHGWILGPDVPDAVPPR